MTKHKKYGHTSYLWNLTAGESGKIKPNKLCTTMCHVRERRRGGRGASVSKRKFKRRIKERGKSEKEEGR